MFLSCTTEKLNSPRLGEGRMNRVSRLELKTFLSWLGEEEQGIQKNGSGLAYFTHCSLWVPRMLDQALCLCSGKTCISELVCRICCGSPLPQKSHRHHDEQEACGGALGQPDPGLTPDSVPSMKSAWHRIWS